MNILQKETIHAVHDTYQPYDDQHSRFRNYFKF